MLEKIAAMARQKRDAMAEKKAQFEYAMENKNGTMFGVYVSKDNRFMITLSIDPAGLVDVKMGEIDGEEVRLVELIEKPEYIPGEHRPDFLDVPYS